MMRRRSVHLGAISKTINMPNNATVETASPPTCSLEARAEGERALSRRLQAVQPLSSH